MTSTQKWTGSYVSGATVAALVILRGGWWCATIKKGGEVYRDSIKGGSPLEIASKVAILAGHPTGDIHTVHYIDNVTYSVGFKV